MAHRTALIVLTLLATVPLAAAQSQLYCPWCIVRDVVGNTVHGEDFDDGSGWTTVVNGGASFEAGAEALVSGSATVRFDGGDFDTDHGEARVQRTFDLETVRHMEGRFRVGWFDHNGWDGESMDAGIQLTVLSGSQATASFEYWFASWEGSSDGKPAGSNVRVISPADPASAGWVHFEVHPEEDFRIARELGRELRVEVYVEADGTRKDRFSLEVDDLYLEERHAVARANVQTACERGASHPWTLGRCRTASTAVEPVWDGCKAVHEVVVCNGPGYPRSSLLDRPLLP